MTKEHEAPACEAKVRFRDLSFWLKLGIIGGIFALAIYTISFIVGFIGGVLGIL